MQLSYPDLKKEKNEKKLHLVRDAYQPIECMHRVREGAEQLSDMIERVILSIYNYENIYICIRICV